MLVEVRMTEPVERDGFAPPIRQSCIERQGGDVAAGVAHRQRRAVGRVDAQLHPLAHGWNRRSHGQHVHHPECPTRLAAADRNFSSAKHVGSLRGSQNDVPHIDRYSADDQHPPIGTLVGPAVVDRMERRDIGDHTNPAAAIGFRELDDRQHLAVGLHVADGEGDPGVQKRQHVFIFAKVRLPTKPSGPPRQRRSTRPRLRTANTRAIRS